ncbi:hypothetical protein Q3V23_02110 [Streptomyces sp. VNUA116]|uniref:hypothetical protein n=1 Tax=Streptomyces sp. VNUA116 TaxID=3062449 RepID=UPI002676402E|nr:hypothetical protein [Streptomyces sp. VNUA116]WKU42958.1 hypothetical protein Q3V23_02110 [Streptomyces sp. VNUA116]
MTDNTGTTPDRPGRGAQILYMLVMTALLLTPCLWVWSRTLHAVQQSSASDWHLNHADNVQFEVVSLLVFGVPLAGASLGGIVASARGNHAGAGVATGACLATLGLVICGVVGFFWMLSHATWEF